MTIDGKIEDEKIQQDINREAAKKSASSSGKIDKYDYLAGEEISSDQSEIREQAKFTYSPLGKAFQKRSFKKFKNLKPEENKEGTKSIEGHFPKEKRNDEVYEI